MKKTKMLKKNYEFKNVFSKGKYYSGKCIEAFVLRNKIQDKNLLGIAISVKVGKATKRNHIKRLIRENYKNLENDIKLGYTFIFLWKKKVDIKNANYKTIKIDMEKIFKKAETFKEE